MQLVRVARHIDSGDTTVAVLKRHGIDRSVFFPQHETSQAVDDGNTHLRGIERRALARNAVKETQDLIRAVDGIEGSGAFAASVSIEHDILSQDLLQCLRVARRRGLVKGCGQAMTFLTRGSKTRPA